METVRPRIAGVCCAFLFVAGLVSAAQPAAPANAPAAATRTAAQNAAVAGAAKASVAEVPALCVRAPALCSAEYHANRQGDASPVMGEVSTLELPDGTVVADPEQASGRSQAQAGSGSQSNQPSLEGLGFPKSAIQGSVKEQALLDKRSHMLQIHQKLGLVTVAALITAIAASGGAKGEPLLAILAKQCARVIDCPKITRVTERMDFVRAEFRAHGRTIDGGGVRALIDAIGSDLRELAAASGQLAADTTGVVGQAVVARYYRGRAEASGFAVADRAVEGRLAEALEMLRWALAVGLSPAAISGGLAQGVRMLGRVSGAPRGLDSAGLVAEVGAPPWKIDRVRQQLRGWEPEGIARALAAVTEADARVKGEGTSSGYALEVAIHTIVACRNAAHRAP